MSTGKQIRLNSIFRKETGKTVIIAADHAGIAGPLPGIVDPHALISACVAGGADGVLTTRGLARAAAGAWDRGTSLILRVTGGFTTLAGKFEEEVISSVEAALLYGACGVAATVKFGHEREGEFIRQASRLADECERRGMPLLIEAMAQGPRAAGAPQSAGGPRSAGAAGSGLTVAARAAAEIGADIVKIRYTGDPEGFAEIVKGCPVPVVIAGGAYTPDIEAVLSEVAGAMSAGAKGIGLGRNVWQERNTKATVAAMAGIVHERWPVEQACNYIQQRQKGV